MLYLFVTALLVRCADIVDTDTLWAVKAVLDTVCGQCCTCGHSAVPSTFTFSFLFVQIVQLRFPAYQHVLLTLRQHLALTGSA